METDPVEYTFPFSTCETVHSTGIAQPYSFWVNFLHCVMILFFLIQAKHIYTNPLLFSILCFEMFHLFSHWRHIPGPIQTYVVHGLTYCINASAFYAFLIYTGKWPNRETNLLLLALIAFDLYAVFSGFPLIFYVLSQALIFITLLVFYFSWLPEFFQQGVWPIVGLIGAIILLMVNEKYHCRSMRAVFPDFPFHVFIEFAGIALFYVICSRFYLL